MTRDEALQKARSLFGERAGVSDGLQMKESLEPAVGVGFYEGADLCIQGKGTTWEKAIAHAETRRLAWQSRVPDLPNSCHSVETVTVTNTKMEFGVPTVFIREQIRLKEKRLEREKLLRERIKAKVLEKWGTTEK